MRTGEASALSHITAALADPELARCLQLADSLHEELVRHTVTYGSQDPFTSELCTKEELEQALVVLDQYERLFASFFTCLIAARGAAETLYTLTELFTLRSRLYFAVCKVEQFLNL